MACPSVAYIMEHRDHIPLPMLRLPAPPADLTRKVSSASSPRSVCRSPNSTSRSSPDSSDMASAARSPRFSNSASSIRSTTVQRGLAQIQRMRSQLESREAKVQAVLDSALEWLLLPYDSSAAEEEEDEEVRLEIFKQTDHLVDCWEEMEGDFGAGFDFPPESCDGNATDMARNAELVAEAPQLAPQTSSAESQRCQQEAGGVRPPAKETNGKESGQSGDQQVKRKRGRPKGSGKKTGNISKGQLRGGDESPEWEGGGDGREDPLPLPAKLLPPAAAAIPVPTPLRTAPKPASLLPGAGKPSSKPAGGQLRSRPGRTGRPRGRPRKHPKKVAEEWQGQQQQEEEKEWVVEEDTSEEEAERRAASRPRTGQPLRLGVPVPGLNGSLPGVHRSHPDSKQEGVQASGQPGGAHQLPKSTAGDEGCAVKGASDLLQEGNPEGAHAGASKCCAHGPGTIAAGTAPLELQLGNQEELEKEGIAVVMPGKSCAGVSDCLDLGAANGASFEEDVLLMAED